MILRVASVSYDCQKTSFEYFSKNINSILCDAKESKVEIVVFPEYLTSALMSDDSAFDIWTEKYVSLFSSFAKMYGLYIAAGTHPTKKNGTYENCAYFFSPDGTHDIQSKIHLVPSEEKQFSNDNSTVKIFSLKKANIAILICYDMEFPELVRTAVHAGAQVLLCPSYTYDQHGDCRVSYCAKARCIENHVFVVQAPLVGRNIDFQPSSQGYGAARIHSPCDIPFPPNGILAEGPLNQTHLVIADLNLNALEQIRQYGNTTPLKHIRPTYYAENKTF